MRKIVNASSQDVQLTRLMSLQLDFDDSDYIFTTFRGAWAREMHRCDQTLTVAELSMILLPEPRRAGQIRL